MAVPPYLQLSREVRSTEVGGPRDVGGTWAQNDATRASIARPQRLWGYLALPDLRTGREKSCPGRAEDRVENSDIPWLEARPRTLTHCLSATDL